MFTLHLKIDKYLELVEGELKLENANTVFGFFAYPIVKRLASW